MKKKYTSLDTQTHPRTCDLCDNNLRTSMKLKDTCLLIHVMKPNLSVMFVCMVVRIKKAWMYILEGITLINLNGCLSFFEARSKEIL